MLVKEYDNQMNRLLPMFTMLVMLMSVINATMTCPIGYYNVYICATTNLAHCSNTSSPILACVPKKPTPSPSPKPPTPSPKPPSPSPKPPTPSPSPSNVPKEFVQAMVDVNAHRAWHRAPPLEWNATVAAAASRWASRCPNGHDSDGRWGENLMWASGVDKTSMGVVAVREFYKEVSYYNFNNPGFSQATGHFTQLVWVGSTQVGMAVNVCPSGTTILVMKFYPPGNYLGEFATNVLRH